MALLDTRNDATNLIGKFISDISYKYFPSLQKHKEKILSKDKLKE
jgi:hypothetical protein